MGQEKGMIVDIPASSKIDGYVLSQLSEHSSGYSSKKYYISG